MAGSLQKASFSISVLRPLVSGLWSRECLDKSTGKSYTEPINGPAVGFLLSQRTGVCQTGHTSLCVVQVSQV
ncbi:hypothetical protein SRHO_G00051000 [Serrasalmus rhombeus]